MSTLNRFLQTINNITRGVNNVTRGVNQVTRTVSSINATVRSVRTLRDQFRGKQRPRPTSQLPGSIPQPQRKPLGLTPVSRPTDGRNVNKRPVRPVPRTTPGPKIR